MSRKPLHYPADHPPKSKAPPSNPHTPSEDLKNRRCTSKASKRLFLTQMKTSSISCLWLSTYRSQPRPKCPNKVIIIDAHLLRLTKLWSILSLLIVISMWWKTSKKHQKDVVSIEAPHREQSQKVNASSRLVTCLQSSNLSWQTKTTDKGLNPRLRSVGSNQSIQRTIFRFKLLIMRNKHTSRAKNWDRHLRSHQ